MSESLNRPIIGLNGDGSRVFRDPGTLLHRTDIRVAVYTSQVRAELWEWREGLPPSGHLVWEHHVRSEHREHTAPMDSTTALAHTSEWLSKQGWPGIRL